MRILLIKLKHIGDALIMTPTIAAIRTAHPGARVSVLVRAGTEGILAGCPFIEKVHLTEAPEKKKRGKNTFRRTLALWRDLRRENFDHVFELGGSHRGLFLALISGANRAWFNNHRNTAPAWWRLAGGSQANVDTAGRHAVECDWLAVSQVLSLPPPGQLVYRDDTAASFEVPRRFIVLHPGTRWRRKQWSEDNWRRLLDSLATEDVDVLVSVGPDPEEIALGDRLCEHCPERVRSTRGTWNFGRLASALHRAEFYLGVDTAAMHLAAACGRPVITLFGESDPAIWAPWRTPFVLFRAPLLVPAPHPPVPKRRLDDIPVKAVAAACRRFLRETPSSQEVVDV